MAQMVCYCRVIELNRTKSGDAQVEFQTVPSALDLWENRTLSLVTKVFALLLKSPQPPLFNSMFSSNVYQGPG